MDANEMLSKLTIPNPCSMDWDKMDGDDQKRHCESCGKHVHDLTKMNPKEAVALLESTQGGICGRVYERPDGTLVITDDPALPQAAPAPFQFHIRTIMAIIAGVATLLGIARLFPPKEDPAKAPVTTPGKGMQRALMGDMAFSRTSSGCTVPASEY